MSTSWPSALPASAYWWRSCALPTVPARSAMRWYANIRRTSPSTLDDLHQLLPRRVRMLLAQMPAHPRHDVRVVRGPPYEIHDLRLRIFIRQAQLQCLGAVDLLHVRLVEHEQGERAGGWRLEQARR